MFLTFKYLHETKRYYLNLGIRCNDDKSHRDRMLLGKVRYKSIFKLLNCLNKVDEILVKAIDNHLEKIHIY